MSTIRQGDIHTYDLGDPVDQRQAGSGPIVILQTDLLNEVEGYGLTLIAPLSTKGRASLSHVRIEPSQENGLSAASFAKVEQVYAIPVADLGPKLGALTMRDLLRVKRAVALVFDLKATHIESS